MPTHLRQLAPVALLLLGSLLLALLLAEIALQICLPYELATIGHRNCRSAELYGWGFKPHETLRILDPDSNKTHKGRTNNHGWRDRDRHFQNKSKAFRVLVLGDSITFGANIPTQSLYTLVSERMLREAEFNVEVINMAYGAWGTDQRLEALRNEGIQYSPQVVITQFTPNDLHDNLYYTLESGELKGHKPFYYLLDGDDTLERNVNPLYGVPADIGKPRLVWRWLKRHSQVLKRLRGTVAAASFRRRPPFYISESRLEHLQVALGIDLESELGEALRSRVGTGDIAGLKAAIRGSSQRELEPLIVRLLENRDLLYAWSQRYYPEAADPDSPEWRLYFALLGQMRAVAAAGGARLAVLSTNELGRYEWERFWHRIAPEPSHLSTYLTQTATIREFCQRNDIDFIEPVRPFTRSRNDPHPNGDGHLAMAESIHRYLLENYLPQLRTGARPRQSD